MIQVEVVNLREFADEFARYPEASKDAARIAINDGAKFLARKSSDSIRKTLAFNPRELWSAANPKAGKISTFLASSRSLEATVRGADSPTLLGRFATNFATRGRVTPRVKVGAGQLKVMRRAFFLRFGNGGQGLAIRLKKGERLLNHRGPTYPLKGDPNALVLYAPSVDQALATAAPDLLDATAERVRTEFLRQLDRLTNNARS